MAAEENTSISPGITDEPKIKVGIMERRREVRGTFNGSFHIHDGCLIAGDFHALVEMDGVILFDKTGSQIARQKEIRCLPLSGSTFTLFDVTIGIHFHWERKQEQTFRGILRLMSDDKGTLIAINEIFMEDYLTSVISSEMNAEAPLEFLKAHAITSRSWLVRMLQLLWQAGAPDKRESAPTRYADETIRWYGREDHRFFDVCADDHCQRYQGITRLISENAREAVHATRGVFLIHKNDICDARYHKACGGLTDNFENVWEDIPVPYLTSVSDSALFHKPIDTELEAEHWIRTEPEAYCNTQEGSLLTQILPAFDQETWDFFRWTVIYGRSELEEIIREKSGLDFGDLLKLTPVERGPSGRIVRLKIEGSKKTAIVGKELEIRRLLSRSHLYSSAFVVSEERDASGLPTCFILHGAGWGHGIGLCQIGAAVMATKGYSAEDILKHYFRETRLQKLY
jgi:stage II sporulation protein D